MDDNRKLNYNIESYEFDDLDLEAAVKKLDDRQRVVIILHLMGHTQKGIAALYGLSESWCCLQIKAIEGCLRKLMR